MHQPMRNAAMAAIPALVFLAVTSSSQAKSAYLSRVPNSAVSSCQTCHVHADPDTQGSSRNVFGVAFASNNKVWNSSLAHLDSDNDGYSNGTELQDPNGAWTSGQANPGSAALVTRPGDASSHPVAATPTPSPTPTQPPASNDPGVVLTTLNSNQWDAIPLTGIFASPAFGETGGLSIGVGSDPTNTFGFWQTRAALNAPAAGLYKLTFAINNSSISGSQRHPELRIRVFRADNQFSAMGLSAETSPGAGAPNSVDVFWRSDGSTQWRIAIDILAFSPEQAGGMTITGIQNTLIAP